MHYNVRYFVKREKREFICQETQQNNNTENNEVQWQAARESTNSIKAGRLSQSK